jgi:putative DNA methylase
MRLIESDAFPFEFLSTLGERESWRKEVHRPVYYLHKWWAKRLGSVFRGLLLGSALGPEARLETAFYESHDFQGISVLDPFMGSGTTVGEAHKLGFTAYGRDINPVAVDAVRVALGPLDRLAIEAAFRRLSAGVGEEIRSLYATVDSRGRPAEILYHFWVMRVGCPACRAPVDLRSSYVFAANAYPKRKPEVRIVCPDCGDVFEGTHGVFDVHCTRGHKFHADDGTVKKQSATCRHCRASFKVLDAVGGQRPQYHHYAKLVLTGEGRKEYLATTPEDVRAYAACSRRLDARRGELPSLTLADGHNTRQAMAYGFHRWTDLFNDRQLLALLLLREAIGGITERSTRDALFTLFSGMLEFNNLFASYKGEGTGAVRHMFAHHILKPERTPIEANVWGTEKSSGSFANLFRSRLLRAIEYRQAPTEVELPGSTERRVCSPPFSGHVIAWDVGTRTRTIALSVGDSSVTGLPSGSVDLVVTDPPFFDNVHYSELADFFRAWHGGTTAPNSTRAPGEVQDADADRFAAKLAAVFRECHRVLTDGGLLVFSYHHSRARGWTALAEAILGAGFVVVNSHPVKAEMSSATPKSQAKEPIQLDMIIVCRKSSTNSAPPDRASALTVAQSKAERMEAAGFTLSRNDRRIMFEGQLLTTMRPGVAAPLLEDSEFDGVVFDPLVLHYPST